MGPPPAGFRIAARLRGARVPAADAVALDQKPSKHGRGQRSDSDRQNPLLNMPILCGEAFVLRQLPILKAKLNRCALIRVRP